MWCPTLQIAKIAQQVFDTKMLLSVPLNDFVLSLHNEKVPSLRIQNW
jgi:hypothetical protein